ncbi:MAG: TM0106 family RecB-like putative nuclease [Planctomycetes bacterium]|nr:TM0106 family RecB-like putative nuclease [Planctomycetota bacterium]MCB9869066.1 TM0106 family RecB-like putative nuclease [Planctomycetota bacterium]MCB9888024.1 TM0106 family RecB-like putative nuclease [Planctomycetota bacterium]
MRITGTHVYTLLRCPHATALDLHEDRAKRRPVTEVEEFVRQRGRTWEAEVVEALGYVEPDYPRGAWDEGASRTAALLRDGVVGVSQGVLLGERRLGIPDLLRREDGESAFGAFHYVVGDIKSSGRPRSDQLLQVAFYSRLLAALQQRAPEYGYLILKDGSEHRFALAEFDAVLEEVEERVVELMEDRSASAPFFGSGCAKCHWSELCRTELEAGDDLSLLQGMTRGLRTMLQRAGFDTCAALRTMVVERAARHTHLEPTLLRRLKQAAEARAAGRPLPQRRSVQLDLRGAAVVHHLYDPFRERMLYFGARYPAGDEGAFFGVRPATARDELRCFLQLVGELPPRVPLLHYGEALPRWFAEAVRDEHAVPAGAPALEARFVDLGRRLRGAAVYPGPVFGLGDHVRYALDADPERAGAGDAAAMWAERPDGGHWLEAKCRADLEDLGRLLLEVCAAAEVAH